MEYRLIPIKKKLDLEFRERLSQIEEYPTPEALIIAINDRVKSDNWDEFPKEVKDLMATYRNVRWNENAKMLQVLSLEEANLMIVKDLLPQLLLCSTLKRVAERILLMFPEGTYLCGVKSNSNAIHIYHPDLNQGNPSPLQDEPPIKGFFRQVANNIFLASSVEDLDEHGDIFLIQPERILGMYLPLLSILVEMVEIEMYEDTKKRNLYWANKRGKHFDYFKRIKTKTRKEVDTLLEMMRLNNEKYEKWKASHEAEDILESLGGNTDEN